MSGVGKFKTTVLRICEWPERERPRERLLRDGADSLTDAQLLAIVLRVGRRQASAVEVALDLLSRTDGLQGISRMGADALCRIPGIGPAKTAQLKAAIELGKRALAQPLSTGQPIRSSGDVFHAYASQLRDLRHETFRLLLLDAKHALIRETVISEGTLTASLVHPREVFSVAVRESAAAVICVHNHPSGDPTPSAEDRTLTRRLQDAGEVLGIPVLDHVVIGDGRYVSFADRGWMEERTVAM
ncbi:MAG: DNA repair protein RadC [Nitrospiraceae bacterium]